jgi:serine/threonine protein kinase
MNESENSLPPNKSGDEVRASVAPMAEWEFPDLKIYGYQILDKLSERSDGSRITYLAMEVKSQRAVVIKEWRLPAARGRAQDYASYLPEIGQLHQLDHPHIPPYLNSFPTATGFCLVRAYEPGISIAQLGSLPPVDIKRVSDKVLQILSDLQTLEPIVIHQNIKPENIIVNTDDCILQEVRIRSQGIQDLLPQNY